MLCYLTLALVAQSHTIHAGAVIVAATADVAGNTGPTQIAEALVIGCSAAMAKLTGMIATENQT